MAKVRFENAVCVCVRECGHAFRTHGESEVQVSGTFTSVGDLIEAKMDSDPEGKVRHHTMLENPLADAGSWSSQ